VSDAEVPLLADETADLQPPQPLKTLSATDLQHHQSDYEKMHRAWSAGAWAHALQAIRNWPDQWVEEGGADFRLLVGFLLYKVDLDDDAVDRLKPLVDEGYDKKRPALLYYLARAEYEDGLFEAAVRNMERFLDVTSPEKTP
jgi:hypothetical protein